ncbi:TetR-like C-terminal domain-containing protein [Bacillus paralicheniformis]|nr:TetR-like C-terminal domain-containing protein [Bacillus paralicheniformis]MEC1050079.1 TetR-like C-terminal domain-containing protein [Bacillus paralicheniformis]
MISALAGTAAWWLENGMPYPPELMAESLIKMIQKN